MEELEAQRQYLSRALLTRAGTGAGHWVSDGTLLFSDVSGFTALSEKLARHGRAGAEEMVGAISTVFTPLLTEIEAYGGDVLKFGGDALLTFFEGADSAGRAATCAMRLQASLATEGRVRTPFGQVRLGMSQGMHTGDFAFFLCGDRHLELLVTGSATTQALAMESAADRGEVLVSHHTAEQLATSLRGEARAGGVLLRTARRPSVPFSSPLALSAQSASEDLGDYVPHALRGRLTRVTADSEHRVATVGFLQFRGCDDLLREHGLEVLHTELQRLVVRVVDLAERYGVTVICTDVGPDGGKFMLATGAPDADERDAESMLRFGVEALEEPGALSLRMGVNKGAVYCGRVGGTSRWTYSTMGDAVNLAARVTGKAGPGTLLATTAALAGAGAGGHIATHPVPPFAVKGKSRPVEAAVVTSCSTSDADRVAPQESTPFVGREVEVGVLSAAAHRFTRGEGSVLELVGLAGTGKSRLAAELHDLLPTGTRLLYVTGERYHRSTPYFIAHLLLRAAVGIRTDAPAAEAGAALARWVEEVAPDLLPWLPLIALAARATVPATAQVDALAPEFRATRTYDVVSTLLETALPGPTLLRLEDTSWYDEASAQLLTALLGRCSDRPWLACLTRRPETSGLRDVPGVHTQVLELAPLELGTAVRLLRATAAGADLPAAQAEELVERAGGNPFFLLQLVQNGLDGGALPADVEAVVAARLDRLPFAARRLLRHASVLGALVDLDVLADVVPEPVPAEVFAELEKDFLQPAGDGQARFAHDLFRTVAYESLPFRRRRELHLRAGLAMEERFGSSARAALLSLHFEAAGDRARTWRYALAAAEQAREASASREAADLYERAMRVSRERPAVERGAVAESLGDVHELLGHYTAATQAYDLARRCLPTVADALRLLRKQGILRERRGSYPQALRWYTQALRTADPQDRSCFAGLAAVNVGIAATRYRQGRFTACVAAARTAVPLAQACDARAELAHAYYLLDAALTDLQDPEALAYRRLALPIYRDLGDLVGQADVLNNTGINAYYEGRWDEAMALYGESRRCREQAGDVVGAATADNNIAEVLCDLGRFAEAQPLFEEALRVWRQAEYRVGVALASSNLARTHLRQGRPEPAALLLAAAEDAFSAMGAEMLRFETRVRRLELLVAQGRALEAQQLSEELARAARALSVSPVVTATLRRAQGGVLLLSGRLGEARTLLEQALTAFTAVGMTWDAEATAAQLQITSIPRQVALPEVTSGSAVAPA